MTKENEERISEYRREIEALKKEKESIESERERLSEECGRKNREIYSLEKKIDEIEAETFRQECLDGLHKVVKSGEIPSLVWWEREEIYKRISGGCTGDWEVGCRGCVHECGTKATNEFMNKYGIEKITYGL